LKLGTSSYGGNDVKKTATVHTNDPKTPKVTLTISGHVEKFVDLKPKYVRLTGYTGSKISVPVTIIPTDKYPFKITKVTARGGSDTFIKYTLKERTAEEGKGYTLLIENMKTEKGRYMDLLTLNTDSQIQPKINIRVYGNIMETKDSQKTSKGGS
jgi:hypothetical protein